MRIACEEGTERVLIRLVVQFTHSIGVHASAIPLSLRETLCCHHIVNSNVIPQESSRTLRALGNLTVFAWVTPTLTQSQFLAAVVLYVLLALACLPIALDDA